MDGEQQSKQLPSSPERFLQETQLGILKHSINDHLSRPGRALPLLLEPPTRRSMLLLLPDLAPKSVHISETDEEADLVKLEEKIKAEVCMLRGTCASLQSV